MQERRMIDRELLVEILGTLGDEVWTMLLAGNEATALTAAEQRSKLATALGFKSPDHRGRGAGDVFLPETRFVEMSRADLGRAFVALRFYETAMQGLPAAGKINAQRVEYERLLDEWQEGTGR